MLIIYLKKSPISMSVETRQIESFIVDFNFFSQTGFLLSFLSAHLFAFGVVDMIMGFVNNITN